MREIFLTPDLSIWGNFEHLWFLWQKSPPPPQVWGKFFWHQIYPFEAILSNISFCGRKAPPPHDRKFFDIQSYPFQAILSNFGFCGRKSTPPKMRENFLTPDLSISDNFEQLWFLWQKSPPPRMREIFFDFRSIHFRQFWATLVFVAEPPQWGKFLTPDFSISDNFEQIRILWQKSPPPWGKIFWQQIYPFEAISSNFGFCGRKAPPPQDEGKFFWHQIYPFEAILSNFGFCGRKAPLPPRMREIFLDTRSIHLRQLRATLDFVAEKPPPQWGKIFLTPDLSIWGNFEQIRILWQKSPPPSFLPFHHGPDSHHTDHTGRIAKVPILQIHTQIPPIWISFIGYQLCQLFKILTYTELQDSGSWCIWKAYRQPYHNAH